MKKDNDEQRWLIGSIKTRYDLNLTTEQAKKIHEYEQIKDFYSPTFEPHFTFWEEVDFELCTFEKILNTEQLEIYRKYWSNELKRHQESLIEQDGEYLKKIEHYKELLSYHINTFLPELNEDISLKMITTIPGESTKVDYLRACYKEFLTRTKQEIAINHFRKYRHFSPNRYESALLEHGLSYLWPNYRHFKLKADDVTKGVIEYIKRKNIYRLELLSDNIKKVLKKSGEHSRVVFEKYYGKPDGSTFLVRSSEEEDQESLAISLLLFDSDAYGYIDND
jgi:adenine-specific DNA methylase